MSRSHRALLSAIQIAFALSASTGLTATLTFTNQVPAGSSWFDPASWDANAIPTINDIAIINAGGAGGYCFIDAPNAVAKTVGIMNSGNGRVQHLHVKPGANLTVGATVEIGYGFNSVGLLTLEGDLTMAYPNLMRVGSWANPPTTPMAVVTQLMGTATVGQIHVGGSQSSAPVGRYVLKGGTLKSLTSVIVGHKGQGTFIQEGGTNYSSWGFVVGNEAASAGICTQAGGFATMGYLHMGFAAGSTGVYHLVGGEFEATRGGLPLIASQGRAWFRQSGGISDFEHVTIGASTGGVGRLTLDGGVFGNPSMLAVGSVAGTGTFEVVGSAATINAQAYTQAPGSTLRLVVSNGLSTVNLSGQAHFDGNLNIVLAGSRPSGVVTAMTYTAYSGAFDTIALDTGGAEIPVLVDDTSLKLDFRPKGTVLTVR